MAKCVKELKVDPAARSWMARPILGAEFTEDPPLQDVYVGFLKQKKDISRAIQKISCILPGFSHLKRCSSSRLLLAPVEDSQLLPEPEEKKSLTKEELKTLLKDKEFDLSMLEDDFQVLKVPARVPRTKSQAARASKIWPVNFHPDPNIERLIDGSIFTERQLELVESYMRVAMEAAKLEAIGNASCNGSAIIVDPEDGRVLAIAASRIDLHPMWHAAMLAVDLVARLQGGGAWKLTGENYSAKEHTEDAKSSGGEKSIKRKHVEDVPFCYPKSLLNVRLPRQESLSTSSVERGRKNNKDDSKKLSSTEAKTGITDEEKSGPYLCTGYWTFLPQEPCPLCAMALLHSRITRIFYGTANQSTGVLGTKAILHSVPGLNHRYLVWGGILERECQQMLEDIKHKIIH